MGTFSVKLPEEAASRSTVRQPYGNPYILEIMMMVMMKIDGDMEIDVGDNDDGDMEIEAEDNDGCGED